MSTINGKVAVITGAGSGIGRELALELARRGASLSLCDRNEINLAKTVGQIKALGAPVHSAMLDVSDRDAVMAYAADVAAHYGVVHQIYNNAGISSVGASVLDTDFASYDRVIAVNLFGVINCTKAFLPHVLASGDGHVINVSSLNGYMAQPELSAYSASKFGVRGFTETLRSEMIRSGHSVRVSVVHPGGVRTNITTSAWVEAGRPELEVTPQQQARARVYNEKLLRMPASKAARIIADGVQANKGRILVGSDAKSADLVVRLAPRFVPNIAAWLVKRIFG
jgi:NAD(P)-dependent dehydrogenase (short-subunit alcohol dehydrogenase family)